MLEAKDGMKQSNVNTSFAMVRNGTELKRCLGISSRPPILLNAEKTVSWSKVILKSHGDSYSRGLNRLSVNSQVACIWEGSNVQVNTIQLFKILYLELIKPNLPPPPAPPFFFVCVHHVPPVFFSPGSVLHSFFLVKF